MLHPEDYGEMDTYLNSLSAATWKGILNAKHFGGDERVITYLRRACGNDLVLWDNQELTDYLIARDLTQDFTPVDERW